ncbi:MAG: hypothetical protein COY77_05345 [Candidatus Omnitrophica bacterium CG_4_10_14_0_8_um_filter_43_18]|nr:MAG: hypothetical protein COS48_02045 [Candidatus Omnitrophica bacterium CG03_land_8_20_14_0_80_43_22]PIY83447.1 MAG: hypothetical protein COY77_05345 [Candidatus Omnitrophica bacterium CG_4_10_14_0_8_um_filter_43_18]
MKIKNFSDKLVWAAITVYAAFFSYISILKYNNFIYNDFDLAIDAQTLWNIIHGSTYSSIHGIVFLGNHMRLILFLIAPFYAIFKTPVFLLVLQSILLGLTAYPLYRIAKGNLDVKFAVVIALSYLLYPALMYMNLFEFHPTALATCFLMFMLYYFYTDKFLKFCVFAGMALSCQENIPLLLAGMGIFSLFVKKSGKWIFAPIIAGAVYFYLAVFKIMPHFNRGAIDFFSLYGHINILNPAGAVIMMFSPENTFFLFQLFTPVLFMPLFYLPLLAVASPIFLQHMLSSRFMEHTIFYHYSAELVPFIFVSAVYAIKRITVFMDNNQSQRAFLWAIALAAIFSSVHFGPLGNILRSIEAWRNARPAALEKDALLRRIPPDASVAATFEFLPKLSGRKHLYSFHHFYSGESTLSQKKYPLPEKIDYALIDFGDKHTFGDFRSPSSAKNIKHFFRKYRLRQITSAGETALYESH